MAVTTALLFSKNIVNKLLFKIKLYFVAQEDKDFFSYLYHTLGFYPKNLNLYKTCFVHRSSTKALKFGCNERLEFLGDAILGSVTADYLFSKYPKAKEGALSEMRSRIVNRQTMNSVGIDLEMHRHILARIPHLKQNDAIGNCLEAFIGAIYKDKGYKKAKEFIIKKIITPHINLKNLPLNNTNYKSIVLQYGQRKKQTIEFQTTQIDSEKAPTFKAEIVINGNIISNAIGSSKKNAEQLAAKAAIKKLQIA